MAALLDRLITHFLRISSEKLAGASEQCGVTRVDSTPDSVQKASEERNEQNRWKFVEAAASKKR